MRRNRPHIKRFDVDETGTKTALSEDEEYVSDMSGLWAMTLKEYGFSKKDLFASVTLVDRQRALAGDSFVTWCYQEDVTSFKLQLEQRLRHESFDTALCKVALVGATKGQQATAEYLSAAGVKASGKVLLLASMFNRLGSSRARYPVDKWPDYPEVHELYTLLEAYIRQRTPGFSSWHKSCTSVLPVQSRGFHKYTLHDVDALMVHLAEEHARLYCRYRVMKVSFTS